DGAIRMSIRDDISYLNQYNEWRRGAEIPQPSPLLVGRAIESVTEAAARYEALRLLNPRQFTELYKRNLAGENFDAMVDELIKARAEG
ncbi:MAG TPA: hypothetical protein VIY48_01060, partial [Candidatus Paceibacterota bacterium]